MGSWSWDRRGVRESLSHIWVRLNSGNRFGHFRLNGLPTLGFSRRRPQMLALRVLEHSCCFTLDVVDPWHLLAPVGSFYKIHGSANNILGWIGSGSFGPVSLHSLAPVVEGSWGLPV